MSLHALATALRRSRSLALLAGLVIFGFLAVISIIPIQRARELNLRERVTARLMQIEMAKQDLAIQRGVEGAAEFTLEELAAESRYLERVPVSAAGEYIPGALGELPRFVRPGAPDLVPRRVGAEPASETGQQAGSNYARVPRPRTGAST